MLPTSYWQARKALIRDSHKDQKVGAQGFRRCISWSGDYPSLERQRAGYAR